VRLAILALVVAAGTARADDGVTLRLGTLAIEGSRYMVDIEAFSADIAKRTRGGVTLAWFANGQLGDEAAMVDQIVRGKLDGAGLSENGLVAAAPEMAVWRYPGLFRSYDDVDRATAALDPEIHGLFAKRGLVFAMWADLGFAHVFATERATTLRQLLALAGPWITKPLEPALFADVIAGRARAWAMPPLYMFAIGKVQPRVMSRVPYRYVVGGLVLSSASWARLSPAQQRVVLDACREWEPRLRKSWRRATEDAVATLARTGAQIVTPTDAELATFFAAAATSRTAHAERAGLADLLARITSPNGW
jgi:TRAP-type transport system periplasmic protein